MEWQPIETAPKDGTLIWAWLYDKGIVVMRWMSAEEIAAEEGGSPDDYLSCWVLAADPTDDWRPKFWVPLDGIPTPPDVVWDGGRGRWRDAGETMSTPHRMNEHHL